MKVNWIEVNIFGWIFWLATLALVIIGNVPVWFLALMILHDMEVNVRFEK